MQKLPDKYKDRFQLVEYPQADDFSIGDKYNFPSFVGLNGEPSRIAVYHKTLDTSLIDIYLQTKEDQHIAYLKETLATLDMLKALGINIDYCECIKFTIAGISYTLDDYDIEQAREYRAIHSH